LKAIENQVVYKRFFLHFGLSSDATWDDVGRAFIKQSLFHEDRNTDDMFDEEK
jgi:hypothetical protein